MSDRLAERVTVRLPTDQLAVLDRLVEAGVYPSRSAAIRAALEAWLIADLPTR